MTRVEAQDPMKPGILGSPGTSGDTSRRFSKTPPSATRPPLHCDKAVVNPGWRPSRTQRLTSEPRYPCKRQCAKPMAADMASVRALDQGRRHENQATWQIASLMSRARAPWHSAGAEQEAA